MEKKSLSEILQTIDRRFLYLALFIVATIPLFMQTRVPNKPLECTQALYAHLYTLKPGSTVLIESDWDNGTRGENGGQFEGLVKLLMDRNIKIGLYSIGAQSLPVARTVIDRLNNEREKAGKRRYVAGEDWVDLGFFPQFSITALTMQTDVRKAFEGKKYLDPKTKVKRDVFESPVLSNIQKVDDFGMIVVITASQSLQVVLSRLSGKVPLGGMVTGVMGPETLTYFASGQLTGMSYGLKGVYDFETMMREGETIRNKDGSTTQIDPIDKNAVGRGSLYYPALHFCVGLLVLGVVIGNIGFLTGRRRRA